MLVAQVQHACVCTLSQPRCNACDQGWWAVCGSSPRPPGQVRDPHLPGRQAQQQPRDQWQAAGLMQVVLQQQELLQPLEWKPGLLVGLPGRLCPPVVGECARGRCRAGWCDNEIRTIQLHNILCRSRLGAIRLQRHTEHRSRLSTRTSCC
jgi:hypothetical protein